MKPFLIASSYYGLIVRLVLLWTGAATAHQFISFL